MTIMLVLLLLLSWKTRTCRSGLSRSKRERRRCPNSSSAGETPVVVCGVFLYAKRNRESLSSVVPSVIFFNPVLKVFTAVSARPLEAGWYGEDVTCLIPLHCKKDSNSWLTKADPLSVTMTCGIPNCANNTCSLSTTARDVVDDIGNTSIHLLWASTRTRKFCPMNSPAKSIWSLDQGIPGQLHGCNGAGGGAG